MKVTWAAAPKGDESPAVPASDDEVPDNEDNDADQ
jgi:hypothetical protein